MKTKLSITVALLLCIAILQSCAEDPILPASGEGTEELRRTALLRETEDYGGDYIDSFVFFGESTTYHMKNRGVLSGGTETKQILADKSGTAILDENTYKMQILHPGNKQLMPIHDVLKDIKPKYLVLTFGLNGAVQNVKRGREYFTSCYKKLIDTVRSASPDTKIILQSCFPVAENMDMTNYSVTQGQLNERIKTLNGWTMELADSEGLRYLNTYEALTDKSGNLKLEYQAGDGHHLTKDAYIVVLNYIRTHGYK